MHAAAQKLLHDQYDVAHVTLQIEHLPLLPRPHCTEPHGRAYRGAALILP